MPEKQGRPSVFTFALIGIVALALIAVLIGLIAGGDDDDDDDDVQLETSAVEVSGTGLTPYTQGEAPLTDAAAPVLSGSTFAGDPITVPGDGPAVVVFLAHWCPHCQREVPVMVEWLAEQGDLDGVDLFGVATAIDPERDNYPPSEWLEREGWTAPTLVDDEDGTAASAYGLTSFPYFVAVDADGKVVARVSGELTTEQLARLVDAARGERVIPLVAATVTPDELEACSADGSTVCLAVYRWTHNELLARGVDWFVAKPLTIALILVLAFVSVKLLTRTISKFVRSVESATSSNPTSALRVKQRAETIGLVLRSVVRITVTVIAVTMILGELGISIGPLIAGAGIVGIALGFGAQTIVKDFLSGMFMLIEDQFGVGDVIDVGEASGTVEAVTLRTTRIRSVDGTLWHVPNGTIMRVGNKSQEWSRALIDVEVAYATNIDHAQQIIKRVADHMWHDDETFGPSILEEPEVWGVEHLGASGVVIRLVVKTLPSDQWKVMRALRVRIKDAFDGEGIEIPFPQQTIWVREGQSPFPTPDKPTI